MARWTGLSESELAAKGQQNRAAQSGTHFEIYLPIATVSEANKHEHWRYRQIRAKAQRQQACLLTQALKSLHIPATIKLTRISPRELDSDNLAGSFKHVRDGIADRLGIDDRDDRVKWEYDQRTGRPKERAIQLTATAI